MSGIAFKQTPCEPGSGRLRDSSARVNPEHYMTVTAARYGDGVELGLHSDMVQSLMVFTAEQARSVTAELLACADARYAAKGVHHG